MNIYFMHENIASWCGAAPMWTAWDCWRPCAACPD